MLIEISNCFPSIFPKFAEYPCLPLLENNIISYNDFFMEFLLTNKPCVIKNISTNWNCSKQWFSGEKINYDFLKKKFGKCDILLYDCREKYFNSHKTINEKFWKFCDYWQSYIDKKYDDHMPLFYLKDWHLKKTFPENNFYEVPHYFASDWINEYLIETSNDDYRFVYMGPKGSWTPFHTDVFSSFSWSVNIFGKKKWLLFPPGKEMQLKDSLGNLPYDITNKIKETPHFEIIQNAGDAVFVPTGWYHQVWNLEDTISINHNWINGCNIDKMWFSLVKSFKDVKKETEDCSEMENYAQHCQIMLNSCFGIDFLEFYKFICYIANKRLKFLKENMHVKTFEKYILGINHTVFDLHAIKSVLELMQNDNDFVEVITNNPITLINEIISVVKNK